MEKPPVDKAARSKIAVLKDSGANLNEHFEGQVYASSFQSKIVGERCSEGMRKLETTG